MWLYKHDNHLNFPKIIPNLFNRSPLPPWEYHIDKFTNLLSVLDELLQHKGVPEPLKGSFKFLAVGNSPASRWVSQLTILTHTVNKLPTSMLMLNKNMYNVPWHVKFSLKSIYIYHRIFENYWNDKLKVPIKMSYCWLQKSVPISQCCLRRL